MTKGWKAEPVLDEYGDVITVDICAVCPRCGVADSEPVYGGWPASGETNWADMLWSCEHCGYEWTPGLPPQGFFEGV